MALPVAEANRLDGKRHFLGVAEIVFTHQVIDSVPQHKQQVRFLPIECWTVEQAERIMERVIHMQYFMVLVEIKTLFVQLKEASYE